MILLFPITQVKNKKEKKKKQKNKTRTEEEKWEWKQDGCRAVVFIHVYCAFFFGMVVAVASNYRQLCGTHGTHCMLLFLY